MLEIREEHHAFPDCKITLLISNTTSDWEKLLSCGGMICVGH